VLSRKPQSSSPRSDDGRSRRPASFCLFLSGGVWMLSAIGSPLFCEASPAPPKRAADVLLKGVGPSHISLCACSCACAGTGSVIGGPVRAKPAPRSKRRSHPAGSVPPPGPAECSTCRELSIRHQAAPRRPSASTHLLKRVLNEQLCLADVALYHLCALVPCLPGDVLARDAVRCGRRGKAST
jgi:hypothetical protein